MPKPDKPTRSMAMLSFCHECMGHYKDGKVDCECVRCPMYPWMPFAKKEPNPAWMDYNPRRVGRVSWEDSEREMTDEQKEAAADRIKKMHAARKKSKK